jgi:hypothetical protein
MSDNETKHLIVDLIYRASDSKYILADLIQKHYLLIWLTNLFEECISHKRHQPVHFSFNKQDKQHNNVNVNLFWKAMTIFQKIWTQLGGEENGTIEADGDNLPKTPPITFLNQMFVLMRIIIKKLANNYSVLIEPSKQSTYSVENKKEYVGSFFKVISMILKKLNQYQINSSKVLHLKTSLSSLYKLSNQDFQHLYQILKIDSTDSIQSEAVMKTKRESFYSFDFFLIILQSDLKLSNCHSLLNSNSIWIFFMNYISKKKNLDTIMQPKEKLKNFLIISKILNLIEVNSVHFGQLENDNDDNSASQIEIEKAQFYTLINLNEFLKNLKSYLSKDDDLTLINQKYINICELFFGENLKQSKTRKRNIEIDCDLVKFNIKKLKKNLI